MKKIIYAAIAVMGTVMMVACGGSGSQMVTKGSKSKMDSLSHAVGFSVSYGTSYNMPDVRLDWDEVMKGAEDGLKVATDVKEDPKHQEAYATLEEFFMHTRQDRLREIELTVKAEDSTATFNPKDVDVFETVNVILYVYQGVRMWSRIVNMTSEVFASITNHIKKQLIKEW